MRRLLLDAVTAEVGYCDDPDDGDYGLVVWTWWGPEAEEAVFMYLRPEELPLVHSLIDLAIDDYMRCRRGSGPLGEAWWVR
jgi:hypothetical protein